MPDQLTIPTITSALREIVAKAAEQAVPGSRVTTLRPDEAAQGRGDARVNVFLYQVWTNAGWRSDGKPVHGPSGGLISVPQATLELHYLLTFFGDDGQLESQRLAGFVLEALNRQQEVPEAILRRQQRQAVDEDGEHFLIPSDLPDSVQAVHVSPVQLDLSELSKLWSILSHTPYALSMAFKASVVMKLLADTKAASAAITDA